jgi:sugar phosphate isomerase/epimerase
VCAGVGYFVLSVPIYEDIGISTGAYANFSLGAALLRIAEIVPAAEILSLGMHSLLDAANARVVELSGLPFSVHGPFLHFEYGSRSAREHRRALDEHRRHMEAAAALGARLYVIHPDLQRRWKGWDKRVQRELEASFEELAALQEDYGMTIAVENLPFVRHTHFKAPGDLDLKGLGLSLDVGHAAVTGTLAAWLADGQYRLVHVHLHDNEGHVGGDQHLPLGRGVIDAAPILELAPANCASVVLEHKNEADVIESLRHLEERGLVERAVR